LKATTIEECLNHAHNIAGFLDCHLWVDHGKNSVGCLDAS
jgi:hypothetical protein